MIVEKPESLSYTSEDKEVAEQDSKMLSEQEVSPFNYPSHPVSCPSILMVAHTFSHMVL